MSIFRRRKRPPIGSRRNNKFSYTLDVSLPHLQTKTTAIKGNRNAVPIKFSADGLSRAVSPEDFQRLWESLSPREQDVTALTCLRYTNPQIAARLHISVSTVKTYVEKVVNRLGIETKADLRVLFSNVDFSRWE